MGVDRDEQNYPLYRDDELERLLKKSKENNFEQIILLLNRIQTEYTSAEEHYLAENSVINLEIRNYYFTILWQYVVSFLYHYLFNASYISSSKQEELEQRKTELNSWLIEQADIYQQRIEPLQEMSIELSELKNNIVKMEDYLANIESMIDVLDTSLQIPNSSLTAEERADKMNLLADYVTQRDALIADIIILYQQIDEKMLELIPVRKLLDETFKIESYVENKIYKEEQIKNFLSVCASIDHPVAVKLRSMLMNRTDKNAEILRAALLSYPDYLGNRELADAVWGVSVYFPQITASMRREDEVIKFTNEQEGKLAKLQSQIEFTDAEYRKKPHADVPKMLENLLRRKRELSELIHTVLLANKENITDTESPIHKKLLDIAESRISEDAIQTLRASCEQITHPIAKELQNYLMYQTQTSLQALKALFEESKDFQNNPKLVNLLWEAGRLFPELKVLDSDNLKQVLVEKIVEVDNQLKMARSMKRSFNEELEALKKELINDFDEIIKQYKKDVSSEIAQLKDDLASVNRELRDSVNNSKLKELKTDILLSLQKEEDSFATGIGELSAMKDSMKSLGKGYYFTREKLQTLKKKYPEQHEKYQRYIENFKKPLKQLEESITLLEQQKETITKELEKFSVAQPHSKEADQSKYMGIEFFKSYLGISRNKADNEPERQSQKTLKKG